MSPSATILLAGLPESGKTTYLAALFHLLRRQALNEAGLMLPALPDQRDYFMEVERAWLEYEPLERSRHASPRGAALPLRTRDGGDFSLSVPDVTGEDFNNLWEYGARAPHLDELAAQADGTLLFIRADDVTRPRLLTEPPIIEVPSTDEPVEHSLDDWLPENAPTQTKLCDILEQLSYRQQPHRLAVVISAWDTVEEQDLRPETWLRMHLPLLAQWLATAASIEWNAFRVSAQGGDVRDPAERQRLAALGDSTARLAAPEQRKGDDLTTPISWLLDLP